MGDSKGGRGIPGPTRYVASLPGRVVGAEKEDRGRFRAGCGVVLGMNYEILTIIACFAALAAWMLILVRAMTSRLVLEVQNLDASLGSVVEQLVEGMPGILGDAQEPINPFQALIFQFLQGKINAIPQDVPAISVTPVDRDDDGKFSGK